MRVKLRRSSWTKRHGPIEADRAENSVRRPRRISGTAITRNSAYGAQLPDETPWLVDPKPPREVDELDELDDVEVPTRLAELLVLVPLLPGFDALKAVETELSGTGRLVELGRERS